MIDKTRRVAGASRGTHRPQLGTARGRGARAQPVGGARRPDRAPRRERLHHLCQRRLLRPGRPQPRRIDRQGFCRSRCSNKARSACSPTARARMTRRSPAARARAGLPGARAPCAPAPAPKCRASAATSPTASRPSARWAWRAIRRKRRTAPSRASSPPSATRSARRSTACSAWPICCSTRRSRPSRRLTPRPPRPRAKRCCR